MDAHATIDLAHVGPHRAEREARTSRDLLVRAPRPHHTPNLATFAGGGGSAGKTFEAAPVLPLQHTATPPAA